MKTCKLLHGFLCATMMCCLSSDGYTEGKKPPVTVAAQQYIPLADPFIMLFDDTYYACGTSSDSGFEVYYSSDLKYWKKHPAWLLHRDDSYADRWFWAPEMYYNADKRMFYLYYSADEHICVATGASPLGPFKQQARQPMRGEKSIDPSLFIDDDGAPYLYFVRFTDGNAIWCARLEPDLTTIRESSLVQCVNVSQEWEKVQDRVTEGPTVIKRGGVYYMLYSANHYQSRSYGTGYATASSPLGPWTKSDGNPILQNPHPDLTGTGHGSCFMDRNGNMKYVFHAHRGLDAIHPRRMYITDVTFTQHGDMVMNNDNIIFPQQIL
ncbi:MAG: glycoside hydrolase family 43 protein [Rikenellaceae bacterium]|nr:glycoside hydrolase family 43 protein [Rikenellaceae bacterium]